MNKNSKKRKIAIILLMLSTILILLHLYLYYYRLGDLPLDASLEYLKQWLSYKRKLNYLKIAGYLLMFIGLSINWVVIYEKTHINDKEK